MFRELMHKRTEDRKLSKLGLRTFSDEELADAGELYLGMHKSEHGTCQVTVDGSTGATRWKFDVHTSDGSMFEVSTGEGGLLKYWQTILLFMQGELVYVDQCNDRMGADQ